MTNKLYGSRKYGELVVKYLLLENHSLSNSMNIEIIL